MATDEVWDGAVIDQAELWPVHQRRAQFKGAVWSIETDTIESPDGVVVDRDVMRHPGAIGIAALDVQDRVLLIRQYRHPIAGYLFELPAGLRDHPEELPLHTAQRELAEEAGLGADTWDVLVDFYNSPGGSDEAFRCFIARDLAVLSQGRQHSGEAEEAHLPAVWLPIDEAVDLVLKGRLHNPTAVTGLLALSAARDRGWTTLRPAAEAMWELPNASE